MRSILFGVVTVLGFSGCTQTQQADGKIPVPAPTEIGGNFNAREPLDKLFVGAFDTKVQLDNGATYEFPAKLSRLNTIVARDFRHVIGPHKEDVLDVTTPALWVSESDVTPRFDKLPLPRDTFISTPGQPATIVTGNFVSRGGDAIDEIFAWSKVDGTQKLVLLDEPDLPRVMQQIIPDGCINFGREISSSDVNKDGLDDLIFQVNYSPTIIRMYCSVGDGSFRYCGPKENLCPRDLGPS